MMRFLLENRGTAPAENLEIEFKVKPASLIDTARPRPTSAYYSAALAPTPPPALKLPVPNDTRRPEFRWYDLSDYEMQQKREEERFLRIKEIRLFCETDLGGKLLRMYSKHLQHGKTLWLRPFYVVFDKHPVQDIEIDYKIYAENQPSIGAGHQRISVGER